MDNIKQCRPVVVFGILCVIYMLLVVGSAFRRGVVNGLVSLATCLVFLILFLGIMYIICQENETGAWISGWGCVACCCLLFITVAAFTLSKNIKSSKNLDIRETEIIIEPTKSKIGGNGFIGKSTKKYLSSFVNPRSKIPIGPIKKN